MLRTPVGIIPVGVLGIVGIGVPGPRPLLARAPRFDPRTLLSAHTTDRLMVLCDATLFRFDHVGHDNIVDEVEQGR